MGRPISPPPGARGRSVMNAGGVYFLVVFALGFALGTLRVLVVVPRIGETAAVLIELPVILIISWVACRRIVFRFSVPAKTLDRLAMGALAFGLLMSAEIGLSLLVFDRTAAEYWRSFSAAPGLVGLLGQLAFAMFPVFQLMMTAGRDRRE